ncbi:MAG TPA: hypothetical protein VF157_01195 [Chloroflexota bacterium]
MFASSGLFLLPMLFSVVPLLVLALIGWAIWRAASAARGGGAGFTFAGLLSGYFQLVQGAALLMLLVGGATLLTAGFSYALGRDFSYRTTVFSAPAPVAPAPAKPAASGATPVASPSPTPVPTVSPDVRARQQRDLDQQQRNGLSQGISLTIVAAILAVLHGFGRRWLLPRLSLSPAPSRIFLGVMLAIFGLTGVIALPLAAAQLAGFYTAAPPEPNAQPNQLPTPPGAALATAIAVLPLWIGFLWATVRSARTREASAVGPASGTAD